MRKLSGLRNILLFITNQCNLRCDYCYIEQGKDVLPFTVAKQVIDNVDDGTIIDFFGGEALLELALLHQIVDYAQKTARKLVFQLFSNGTIYNDEVLQLLDKGVSIGVSCDGLSSKARTNDAEITRQIEENIKKYKARNPRLGTKTAITPGNVNQVVENTKFLNELGFFRVSHFALRENVWDSKTLDEYQTNLKRLVAYYMENIDRIELEYLDQFVVNHYRDASCWAGREGVAVDGKGDLFPCQRFLTKKAPFVIGTVWEGITNHKFRQYSVHTMLGCQECRLYPNCHNFCIAAQWEECSMSQPIPCVCELTKISCEVVEPLKQYKDFFETRMRMRQGMRHSGGGDNG